MHIHLDIYYFIDDFNRSEINNLNKKITLIYRNYNNKYDLNIIKNIRDLCRKNNRKFFISNRLKIAKNLQLDGVYIPSFNKIKNFKNLNVHKNFTILGSAHNRIEIMNKNNQGCNIIFLAPTFKVKKKNNFLGIIKFNILTLDIKKNFVALGGINEKNLNKLKLLNCRGLAGISWIKKNGLKLIRPLLNNLDTN